jgi:hypothetical protein
MQKKVDVEVEVPSVVTPYKDSGFAARYLTLAVGTLAIMRHQGRGPKFVLVGTRVRYLISDLDAWVQSCTTRRRPCPGAGRPPGKSHRRKRAA